MSLPPCVAQSAVDRHFGPGLSAEEEHAMRAHLPTCGACRARYERHLLLESLDPMRAGGAGDRIARGLALDVSASGRTSTEKPGRAWASAPVFAAVALAACVALLVTRGIIGGDPRANAKVDAFTARGGATEAASRVLVYTARAGEKASRAGEVLGAHDALAFSYENGAGKKYLMIFGTDEHRHVFWYYPAWSNPAEAPVSIAIETGKERHDLPEAITHDLEGDELEIHAVFSDEPLVVRDVERQIEASPRTGAGGALLTQTQATPASGRVETTIHFTVER